MRLRSLRSRLLVGVVVIAAVCLAALGAIIYAQQRDFLTDRVDEQARSAMPAIERALDAEGVPRPGGQPAPPEQDGPPSGGRGPGGPAITLPPGVYGERRDADGETLGSVVLTFGEDPPSPPDLPADVPVDRIVTVDAEDGSLEYRVDAAPTRGGGTTIVAIPLSGVEEQLDQLLVVEAAVIGGTLLLMAGLGWWVVLIGLRPLDRMGATAGRIAEGDLSHRVEPAGPDTEVGRLGLSLNAMLDQIEEAFAERNASEERLRHFLADASHELRTPLTSIRGYAELYRMGAASDPEEARKAMSRIEQEAARMGVLVEDLLLLARADEVRDAERAPVDLAELARDAVADARAADRDRPIALDVTGDDTVVSGDADQLRQVLANLLRNALVHTPEGTQIRVAVDRAGERVRLVVEDDGPGLPVADGAALFERFRRGERDRDGRAGGAGLGLAIVHAIVTAHGGTVRAETRAEGGASFTVEL